jgi:hypothetical protein
MSKYTKTLSPPEGETWLETVDGLKYWLYHPGPTLGIQLSVRTEDPSIFMHAYGGGGRDSYPAYLFCYKGTRIGFADYEIVDGLPIPTPPKSAGDRDEGRRKGTSIRRIFTVGIPVYDPSWNYFRDENGALRRDENDNFVWNRKADSKAQFVTGLSWADYKAGKRDKFPSRQIQDEMLVIWADLFAGLVGRLRWEKNLDARTFADGSPRPIPEMRFDERVLEQFESGELIVGNA